MPRHCPDCTMTRWPEDPVLKPVHDADPDAYHARWVPGCDYCDYHWEHGYAAPPVAGRSPVSVTEEPYPPPRRLWRYRYGDWRPGWLFYLLPWPGSDEYGRRTWVVPVHPFGWLVWAWRTCHCEDCQLSRRTLAEGGWAEGDT